MKMRSTQKFLIWLLTGVTVFRRTIPLVKRSEYPRC